MSTAIGSRGGGSRGHRGIARLPLLGLALGAGALLIALTAFRPRQPERAAPTPPRSRPQIDAAFMDALDHGKLAKALALARRGANVRARSDSGQTALGIACWQLLDGHERRLIPALVDELVSRGAEVNARANDGDTALTDAIAFQDGRVVRL